MSVIELLHKRRSVRSFSVHLFRQRSLRDLLRAAARSPSGTNMQPWRVYVLTGEAKDRLTQEVLAKRELEPHRERPPKPFGEYDYNPEPLFEPFLSRRRTVGFSLYQILGVAKGDRAASWAVAGRNFEFFGAPVGLIFTIDRSLQQEAGSTTAYFCSRSCLRPTTLASIPARRLLGGIITTSSVRCSQSPTMRLSCAVCLLGYADKDAPANKLVTERESVAGSRDVC